MDELDEVLEQLENSSQESSVENSEDIDQPKEENDDQPPRNQVSADPNLPVILSTGSFTGFRNYQPSGQVRIIRADGRIKIEFLDGFTFTPTTAPDPFVYIAPNAGQQDTQGAILISKLQSTSGRQAYAISEEDYNRTGGQIMIWCEAFNVYMGGADLV